MQSTHPLRQLLSLIAVAFLLASCSTAKITTQELTQIRRLTPPAGKALVYIVRPSLGGGIVRFGVSCDNQQIGYTHGKRFIYTYLRPGVHHFVAKSENKDEIYLEAENDKTYFLEQQVKGGLFFSRVKWKLLDEVEGRKKLNKCKLSGDCQACGSAI